jgi:DNA polymerase-3 subunit delta
MNINFRQIEYQLKNHNLGLNFFLIGDDFGQIFYTTHKLINKYFLDEEKNIEKIEFSDLQKDHSLLVNTLQSQQLFSSKKAVIIQNVGDTIKNDILEVIKNNTINYLLIFQAENLRKTSKTYKCFESLQNYCFVNCYKLDLNGTQNFIEDFLRKNSINFNSEMTAIIANSLPDNVLLIQNELEKLVKFLGERKDLSIEIIEKIISGIKDLSYINLVHAIIFKNRENLITQLNKLEGINLFNSIRIIQNYLSKVLLVKNKETFENHSLRNLIDNLRPPIFFKEKSMFFEICKKISFDEALNFMEELLELELKIKNSKVINNNLILNQYFIQKIHT